MDMIGLGVVVLFHLFLGSTGKISANQYHAPCLNHGDCDTMSTHLRCLSSSGRGKQCVCRKSQIFDSVIGQCRILDGVSCHPSSSPQCLHNSICQLQSEGLHVCRPVAMEMPVVIEAMARVQDSEPYNAVCSSSSDCERAARKTYLTCISAEKKCLCRKSEEYEQGQCRRKVGANCTPSPSRHKFLDQPPCVNYATCVPLKTFNDEITNVGECEVLANNPPPPMPLGPKPIARPGEICAGSEDCMRPETYLKCLRVNESSKICSCGAGNIFNTETNQCELGLGIQCDIPSARNPEPQKCISFALCKQQSSRNPHGVCACSRGRGSLCNKYEGVGSTLSSHSPDAANAPAQTAGGLMFIYLLLIFLTVTIL